MTQLQFKKNAIGAVAALALVLAGGVVGSLQAAEGSPVITVQPAGRTVFQGDPVTFSVTAEGTAPLGYQWRRNGAPIALATSSSYTLAATAAADDGALFSVVVSNTVGSVTSSNALLRIDQGALQTNSITLVPFNAVWRYNQMNANLGTVWKTVGYDDTVPGWSSGPGVFDAKTTARASIGGQTVGTQLTLGNPGGTLDYTNYYFRTHFNFSTNNVVSVSLKADVLVDDAALTYLNGQDFVGTDGLNFGSTFATTWSATTVGDAAVTTYDAPSGALVHGDNVLAAEAHQVNLTSSDITFGLQLSAVVVTRERDTQAPVVQQSFPTGGSTVEEVSFISVTFNEPVTGVDAADLQVNDVAATNLLKVSELEYQFTFPPPPTGTVAVTWAPGHGIADRAATPNAFAGAGWTFKLDPNVLRPMAVISEFLANNDHGLEDEDGSRSDWIEIHNPGPLDVNLGGWFLTDLPNDLTQWRFPNITLAANRYLLVWASEKNRTNPAAPLHTNFKLERSGEYLALVDPRTNVVSSFSPAYPAQSADVSYGRDRVDLAMTGYFTKPTPGAQNAASGSGFAPEPVISIDSGMFTNESVLVSITAPEGIIRYTLNGSPPATNSPIYTGPLRLATNVTLKARVFQTNLWPSRVVSRSYFFLDNTTREFSSNLPLLIMDTRGKAMASSVAPGQPRTLGGLAVIPAAGGRAALVSAPEFIGQAEFEIFGQTSAGFPKQPHNIEVQDELGNDLAVPLLGMPAEADWKLRNPYSDKCMMNDFLAYELFENMGHYQVRRRFVEVFLDKSGGRLSYPGDYYGILVLLEKIERGDDRVDIKDLTPAHTNEPAISGGYMFKKDKDSTGDLNFSTSGGGGFGGQALKIHEPKPRDITTAQLNWLRNYLNLFESSLYASDWLTRKGTNHYSHYIDVDSFVDMHWIVEFTKQIDGYRLSSYFTKDRGGKLKMEPIWDWNLSFGNADYADGQYTERFYYLQCDANAHIWLRRMITGTTSATSTSGDPDFNQQMIDRWSVLRTNVLNATNVITRVDQIAAYLNEAQARDFARFPRLGTYIWPNPAIYSTPVTYSGIITNMKNWILGRYLWIDSLYLKSPSFNHSGGDVESGYPLTMAGPVGATLYYTLDGSDPRLPGGGVSPSAQTYSTAVPVTRNVRAVARSWNAGSWSGPTAATLVTALPPLRITELMYHPAPPPAGNTNDADNFEYLELTNIGATPLSLLGFRFTNGVDYTFTTNSSVTNLAAGGRVLVVANRAAFVSRYPAQAGQVAGEYTGNLGNAGERIVLVGPVAEVVHDFVYRDGWYPTTDGLGFSLVTVDQNAAPSAWANQTQWRASAYDGGSPGAADAPSVVVAPVLVNEVLANPTLPTPDAIELFNPNPEPVDIGDWYLTDSLDAPRKYRIPAGTSMPGYGFVVFHGDTSFNTNPAAPNNFGISSTGDDVYLLSGDSSGRLTGYSHGFDFGPSALDVTFGAHTISTGERHFVAQSANSLGGSNASPRVGPVVIDEIMFHPPDLFVGGLPASNQRDEYVELINLTDQAVPLFDPLRPTNTWQLQKAVDFAFPTNAALAPHGRLLVVSFSPERAPDTLAAFRARFALGDDIALYGPYDGQLDNTGERLELRQPGAPNIQSGVPAMILADRVDFGVAAPWPATAGGTGASLQRRVPTEYGNDPANWVAGAPSAGRDRTVGEPPSIVSSPASLLRLEEQTATFQVQVAGTPPFLFQWLYNGLPLDGAYQNTLVLTNVSLDQAGIYSVFVMSDSGSALSGNAQLTVKRIPSITLQPVGTNISMGSNFTLRVAATGTGTLRYQWRLNGQSVAGATNSVYAVASAQWSDGGIYEVLVSDAIGTRTSQPAPVMLKPVISSPPASVTLAEGQDLPLTVVVEGTGPLGYRWRRASATMANTSEPFFTVPNMALTNAGNYTVIVSNSGHAVISTPAAAVLVVSLPSAVAAPEGTNVTLRAVVATPTMNFTLRHQWYFNGTLLTAGTNTTVSAPGSVGGYTNDLVLTNFTAAQAGSYTFLLTNMAVASGAFTAQVSVATPNLDSDGDGLPDEWETAHGLNPGVAADAALDADQDGLTNGEEFVAGTDPQDPASTLRLVVLGAGEQPEDGLAFRFTAVSNRAYRVEFREGLGFDGWSNVLEVAAGPATRQVGVTNTATGASARYYRVIIPPAQ